MNVSSKSRSPVSLMLLPPWIDSVNVAASVWILWSATTFFWWFAVVVWTWSNIFGRASATEVVVVVVVVRAGIVVDDKRPIQRRIKTR